MYTYIRRSGSSGVLALDAANRSIWSLVSQLLNSLGSDGSLLGFRGEGNFSCAMSALYPRPVVLLALVRLGIVSQAGK